MKFEKLVQSIIKENIEYAGVGVRPQVSVFDSEDALNIFDTVFGLQLTHHMIRTSDDEGLRKFRDYITSNKKKYNQLTKSFLSSTLYVLNNVLKKNYKESVIKFYLETTKDGLDYNNIFFFGVGIWNNPRPLNPDIPTLIPFSGYYRPEMLDDDLNDKVKRIGKENIEISDIYQPRDYQFKHSFLERNMYYRIDSKKFSMNNLPSELFEVGEEYASKIEDDSWVPPELNEKLKKILEDLTEQRFEDTIKSQKVGKVLSRL